MSDSRVCVTSVSIWLQNMKYNNYILCCMRGSEGTDLISISRPLVDWLKTHGHMHSPCPPRTFNSLSRPPGSCLHRNAKSTFSVQSGLKVQRLRSEACPAVLLTDH